MTKLLAALRLVVAFVLGVLAGAVGLAILVSRDTGVGNLVIAATPHVKDLKAGLERVEMQRDDVTRRLERLSALLEQVEKRYEELGRRFETMEAAVQQRGQITPPAARQLPASPSSSSTAPAAPPPPAGGVTGP
jgi:hypothetical protein